MLPGTMSMEDEHQTVWHDTQLGALSGEIGVHILWARPAQPHALLLTALLSPVDIYPMPHQTQVRLLHLTSPPKSCSELAVVNYFVHW